MQNDRSRQHQGGQWMDDENRGDNNRNRGYGAQERRYGRGLWYDSPDREQNQRYGRRDPQAQHTQRRYGDEGGPWGGGDANYGHSWRDREHDSYRNEHGKHGHGYDYERPRGEANPHGPQYEQGGRYPGTRDPRGAGEY
ncbi:MAG TPA: hypothetical protein VL024_11465, partial [Castellaniella sp.]|nr:hypothetical protein [Castellaniella sp.]